MQIKSIQKAVRVKMTEWLATIKDEILAKELRKNILVSGGSICSMLQKTKVNDFDVYIKDRVVLMALVKYYTKDHPEVMILDGTRREEYLLDLKDRYNTDQEKEIHNAYAVSVRNLKPDQIKLFFGVSGVRVNEGRPAEEMIYLPKFFSPNAISLSNDLQIVIRFFGDAEQIHKTFDYVHATNYFTFDEGLVTNKAALESIITGQLKYQGSQYPVTSIIRMRKFLKRGWNIGAGEILKILFQVSELNLRDPDVLEEQIIGIDVAYFAKLIEILRNLPEDAATPGGAPARRDITAEYLSELIDRVFNSDEEDNEAE